MILGFHWAELVFCAVIFTCGCIGLWPEFKPGGSFSSQPVPDDVLAQIFALPLPDGVDFYDDVLPTLDWIEAL